jgi:hypothetical protein
VGLLWKADDSVVLNNFFSTQRRFTNLEGKLAKNEELAETYRSAINTYVNLKHARKLSKEEAFLFF